MVTEYPIRLILGDGAGVGRSMTIIYEQGDSTAGRLTIKYDDPAFRLVHFHDGPSCVIAERTYKMFGQPDWVVHGVYINRYHQK